MTFGENLKKKRKEVGYTAKDFAKKIGCAYTTYLTYENESREPKYETLIQIATALHVSIDELLGYTPEHPNETARIIAFFEKIGYLVAYEKRENEKGIFYITSRSGHDFTIESEHNFKGIYRRTITDRELKDWIDRQCYFIALEELLQWEQVTQEFHNLDE